MTHTPLSRPGGGLAAGSRPCSAPNAQQLCVATLVRMEYVYMLAKIVLAHRNAAVPSTFGLGFAGT